MIVELVSKADLQVLDDKVSKILELLTTSGSEKANQWCKSPEVKEILGCSDATLKNYRERGILPFTKLCGTYFYNREQVLQILKSKSSEN